MLHVPVPEIERDLKAAATQERPRASRHMSRASATRLSASCCMRRDVCRWLALDSAPFAPVDYPLCRLTRLMK
eukprot:149813-Chlamydomonas_euryale.AAC.1